MRDGMEKRLAESLGDLAPDPEVRDRVLGGLSGERAVIRPWGKPLAVAATLLVAASVVLFAWPDSPEPAPMDPTPVSWFVSDGDGYEVARIMQKRLDALGVPGEAEKEETTGEIRLRLPPEVPVEEVMETLLRPGTLEFRIVIEDPEALGGRVAERWDGKEPMRVRTDDGFTGEDLDPDEIRVFQLQRVDSATWSVLFSVWKGLSDDFARFSRENKGRLLAIIVDGKILSAPRIMSEIPGQGAITGEGPKGLTKAEAESLAAALISGAYPSEVRPR